MNGKDIFQGLKYIGDDLIEQAEFGEFPAKAERTETERRRRTFRRPFQVAAIIALALLLVGCAVVYLLSVKEIKLGENAVTFDVYNENPNEGDPFEPIGQKTETQQVLTLAGMGETPAAQAAREWYAFLETYDPDYEIRRSVWGKEPEFPAEYKGYGLYTQEMKDRLDQILAKYDLKLRGRPMEFPSGKVMLKALGMEVLVKPEYNLSAAGHYYENGNLNLTFTMIIPNANGEEETVSGDLYYRSKDCFIPDTAVLTQAQWEEWNYTTASGDNVLILRSEETSKAWIFCDQPGSTVSMQVNIIREMTSEMVDGVEQPKFDRLGREELEKIADAVDFSLEPRLIENWEELLKDTVPAGQVINGYKIEPVSAFTDGYGYQIVLRITAPEGVALTDPEDHTAGIKAGAGIWGRCVEDGDGQLNTCDFILAEYTDKWNYPEDGSLPYPEGHVIPVYWEDLYFSRFDFENVQDIVTLLTEGTWSFDIALTEADLREVELLAEPITTKACTGWKIDGTDVIEDVELKSVKLRALGIDLEYDQDGADFLIFTGKHSSIVMLDGTQMDLYGDGFDQPIDLEQVAYIQLAGGEILPMPGVDPELAQAMADSLYKEPEGDELPVYADGVELVEEPILVKRIAGYASDATGDVEELYEYHTLRSFVLHPEGAVAQDKRAYELLEEPIPVFMKDGSQIGLTVSGFGRTVEGVNFTTFDAETTIDLNNVDHILLPDATVLTVS